MDNRRPAFNREWWYLYFAAIAGYVLGIFADRINDWVLIGLSLVLGIVLSIAADKLYELRNG